MPNLRLEYREEALADELRLVFDAFSPHGPRAIGFSSRPASAQPRKVERRPSQRSTSPSHGQPSLAKKYEAYDGPFARRYEMPPRRPSACSPGRANSVAHPEQPAAVTATSAGGDARQAMTAAACSTAKTEGVLAARPAVSSGSGGARESRRQAALASGLPLGDRPRQHASFASEKERRATEQLHDRLDEQYAMLLEAQALAAAAERRAAAAAATNRLLLLAAVASAVAALTLAGIRREAR